MQQDLGTKVFSLDRQLLELTHKESRSKAAALKALQDTHIQAYLRRFPLTAARLPGVGPTFKSRLTYAGILTAADVDYRVGQVAGIGYTRQMTLRAWRQRLEAEAQATAPAQLSSHEVWNIESRTRAQKRSVDSEKQRLQALLSGQVASIRQKFAADRQLIFRDEQNLRNAEALEISAIQQRYSAELAALDARANAQRKEIAPALDGISAKLRETQKKLLELNWRSAQSEHERLRFRAVRFRHYLKAVMTN